MIAPVAAPGDEAAPNGISLDAARAEVAREFNVRKRCFPRWVEDGRMTAFEAKERLERQAAACFFLERLAGGVPAEDKSPF